MKAETELRQAFTDAMAIFEDGVSREYVIEKLARLVAVTEVFADVNFSDEEHKKLFDIAGSCLPELQRKYK